MGARAHGLARLHRKLDLLTKVEQAAVGDTLEDSAMRIAADANGRSGHKFDVTHEMHRDRLKARVGTNDFTALFSEFGTTPHAIEPKNRKALSFPGADGRVAARRVMHPGHRAEPFLFPAVESERPTLNRNIRKALNAAHRKVARQ